MAPNPKKRKITPQHVDKTPPQSNDSKPTIFSIVDTPPPGRSLGSKDMADIQIKYKKMSANIEIEGDFLDRQKIVIDQVNKYLNTLTKTSATSFKTKKQQLEQHGFEVIDVEDDGNCLFRAMIEHFDLNPQLFDTFLAMIDEIPELAAELAESSESNIHHILRKLVVYYMQHNSQTFAPFMEDNTTLDQYLDHMAQDTVWGGNQEIQALANMFNITIHVFGANHNHAVTPTNLQAGVQLAEISLLHTGTHFMTIVGNPPINFNNQEPNNNTNDHSNAATSEIIDLSDSTKKRNTRSNHDKTWTAEQKEALNKLIEQMILETKKFHIENVKGDGNCLFRAVTKLLPGLNYKELRHIAEEHLKAHREDFSRWISKEEMDSTIKNLGTDGKWAGSIAFQCLADALGINFYIVGGECNYQVISRTNPNTPTNLLIFFDGSHYQAFVPNDTVDHPNTEADIMKTEEELVTDNEHTKDIDDKNKRNDTDELLLKKQKIGSDNIAQILEDILQSNNQAIADLTAQHQEAVDNLQAIGNTGFYIGLASLAYLAFSTMFE